MERNYWQEYWNNYYKFMAVYLSELQNAYPNEDITNKYVEAANLFEPSMPLESLENYVQYDDEDDYNPSSFFMIVDRADNRSIQGFRIACESGGRIRFVPMAVEYRNINVIECAF